MKTFLASLVICLLIFAGCNTKTNRPEAETLSHQNEISITGAYALAPLMQKWVDEFHKTHPTVKFTIVANGSDQGLADVLTGKNDIGMISAEIPKGQDGGLQIIPVSRLGVVPVISSKNPYIEEISRKGISREDLVSLFAAGKPKTWGDIYGKSGKDPVNVYIRKDSSGASKTLARYLWIETNELKGKAIDGETNLIDAVKADPLSLGYCNFIYTLDQTSKQFSKDLRVLPIDFDQNGTIDGKEKIFDNAEQLQRAMWLGKFPCSLVRNLYLVTKGKPHSREVAEFLYWVITDGQKMVSDNGYIELHTSEIQFLIKALKPDIR
jgi:phosphate transport system substrate-binding protein